MVWFLSFRFIRRSFIMTAFIAGCVYFLSRCFKLRNFVVPARRISEFQPFIKHKTLTRDLLENKDLLVVGDVHGCYDEMMMMLDKVNKMSARKLVTIFVGDMINKGPKNIQVLDFIMNEKDVYCVRGNHEQHILRKISNMKEEKEFVLKDSLQWIKNLSSPQIEYIRNLPYTLSIPHLNMIVVHAGLTPNISLHQQNENDMMNMRRLQLITDEFHGQIWKATSTHHGEPWAKCWRGPMHIYFGHDAITKLQKEEYCTGLDTGCVYGGKLTAVLIRTRSNGPEAIDHKLLEREFFQIEPKEIYVPVD